LAEQDPPPGATYGDWIGERTRPTPGSVWYQKICGCKVAFGYVVGTFRCRNAKPNKLGSFRLVENPNSVVAHDLPPFSLFVVQDV
jgi:hypothetical protein